MGVPTQVNNSSVFDFLFVSVEVRSLNLQIFNRIFFFGVFGGTEKLSFSTFPYCFGLENRACSQSFLTLRGKRDFVHVTHNFYIHIKPFLHFLRQSEAER